MMRLMCFVMFATLLCVAAFAKDPPRIAVYVTGNVSDDNKKALGTRMLATLINSGRYRGIERANAFLAELDKEQERQRSGAIHDDQITALGRQFGVGFICVADITPAFGEFQISARIIDVETAEVVLIGEAHGAIKTMDDLARVSDRVVKNMFSRETAAAQPAKTELPRSSAPASTATYTLSIRRNPASGGTILRSPNSPSYVSGTEVTLTVVPATRFGYRFINWSGVPEGVNPMSEVITIRITNHTTLTANFQKR